MKKQPKLSSIFWLTFILSFILFNSVNCQNISLSPTSFKFWGEAKYYSQLSVGYKDIKLHYLYNRQTLYDNKGNTTYNNFALSYTPLDLKILNLGLIYFYKPFPTEQGKNLNLYFDFYVDISKTLRLSYVHISNAFTGEINPGIDFIQLTINLN